MALFTLAVEASHLPLHPCGNNGSLLFGESWKYPECVLSLSLEGVNGHLTFPRLYYSLCDLMSEVWCDLIYEIKCAEDKAEASL